MPSLRTLLLACVIAATPAQQGVRFQANRHLERFEECRASEFADLFPLDEFDRKSGALLQPAELEELQRRWSEVLRSAEERIARIRADPQERALHGLEKRLGKHSYLGRVDFKRVDAHAPFFFYVQRPDQDDPTHAKGVAESYSRWFAELRGVFEDEFAMPLGLARREDYPAYAIFVLRSNGAYDDYADALDQQGLYITRAHYDPELRLAVTFKDVYGRLGEQKRDDRRAALHELVHAFQHAYRTAGDALPAASWLNEGLADYLSFHDGVVPAVLRAHQLDLERLRFFAEVGNPEVLDVCLLPLEELAALEGYAQVLERLLRRAQARGLALPPEVALGALYAQSSLWVHYLRHGENGKHREAFGRFLRAALAGSGGLEDLRAAFTGIELGTLDAGYRRYLNQHLRAALGSAVAVPASASATESLALSGSQPAPSSPAPRPIAAFEPAELAPASARPEVAFELALGQAQRGEIGAALGALSALVPEVEEGALRERVAREVARLEELVRERRRFLEQVVRKGEKLDVRLGERRVVAVVREVSEEAAVLGDNRQKLERLALESIEPAQLAKLMRDKKYGFTPGWSVAYASVLGGQDDWRKLAKGPEPEVAALRADAEADYPARLRRAQALEGLSRLAAAPLPTEAPAAELAFAELVRFQASFGELEPVKEKAEALARYGAALLRPSFAAGGPGQALRGRTETLGDGRVRLSYGFAAEEELEDFAQRRYLSSQCDGRPPGDFAIAGGVLTGVGCLSAHHALEFEEAVMVRCSFRVRDPADAFDPRIGFQVGLHDDGLGAFVACAHDGGLEVRDLARKHHEQRVSSVPLHIEERYALELRCDGAGQVESLLNERSIARLSAGPRQRGGVFLWASTALTLEIDELVIEGKATEAGLERLRAGWIERRLAEAGLVAR
jgi:hypothetical protein